MHQDYHYSEKMQTTKRKTYRDYHYSQKIHYSSKIQTTKRKTYRDYHYSEKIHYSENIQTTKRKTYQDYHYSWWATMWCEAGACEYHSCLSPSHHPRPLELQSALLLGTAGSHWRRCECDQTCQTHAGSQTQSPPSWAAYTWTQSPPWNTSYRAILKSHHHFNSLRIWTQSPPWNTNITAQSSSPIITSKAYTWTQSPPWNTQVTVQSLSPIITSTAYTWTQSPPWNRLQCNPLQQLTHEHKVLLEAQLTVPSSLQQLIHEHKVIPETHRLQCNPQVPSSLQQYTPIIPFGFTLEFVACQSVEFRSLNLYINMHQCHNGACQCTEFVTVGEGEDRTATA